ncbi:MAG: hypothetical protein ACI9GB_002208 [Halioglobus sp.]|jgi:hypothetical protein
MFRQMLSSGIACIARLSLLTLLCGTVSAQELTPRAYWPTPNGTNVLVAAYQKSTGDIVTDPSLPLTSVDSAIDYLQLSYQRTFSLGGRTASIQLSAPYSQGETTGLLKDEFRSRETSGIGDTRVRLSYNLSGAPSMDAAEFRALRHTPKTIVGASLLVQAPTGEYQSDKLINIGTNRWAVKPAIGVIWPIRPSWLLEFEVGAWLFGDNDEYLGKTRKQDPVLSTEIHLVKRIRSGFWASLDANFYVGGRASVNGSEQANLQRNSRLGATVVYPFKKSHAIRSSFSTAIASESGGDFEIFSLSYLYVW